MSDLTMIDVYFCVGGFASHPLYKEIFRNAPQGVNFFPSSRSLKNLAEIKPLPTLASRSVSNYRARLTEMAKDVLCALRIPRIRVVRNEKCDVIHSCQNLILTRKPWVVDFEIVSALTWYRRRLTFNASCRRRVERFLSSANCKKILPWSNASRRSLMSALDVSKFAEKVEVIYPAIASKPYLKKGRDDQTRLLFVGGLFYLKGGQEVLKAFDILSREHNVALTVVSTVPNEIVSKYARMKNLVLRSRVSAEELSYHYRNSDIFVLPTYVDTFGFVYLEAMSYAMPIVASCNYAVPEIVKDGETGYLVKSCPSYYDKDFLPRYDPTPAINGLSISDHDPLIQTLKKGKAEIVNELVDKLLILIEDEKLRTQMGEAAKNEIEHGRFSFKERNKNMYEVYRESLE